jgi:tryptophan halogenase
MLRESELRMHDLLKLLESGSLKTAESNNFLPPNLENQAFFSGARTARPDPSVPDPYRKIAIIGGGTAGYLAALAFRAKLPHLEVTLIESPTIPIIGVGEATTPGIVSFLHKRLGIDVADFYEKVQPTWKNGIRFEWGLPGDYAFQAPFDWHINNVGMLGSMHWDGDINSMTMQSIFMERNVVPMFRIQDRIVSLLHRIEYAYHLDNGRFVDYLTRLAQARGVHLVSATLKDATLTADGERIESVVTEDGRRFEFDLYVDCSGFRSFLLEQKLGSPFISYADTLFTDTAVTFNRPHGGRVKPYTTAKTMDAGWCWNISMRDGDHQGYVFSSEFLSIDDAKKEIVRRFGEPEQFRVVKFRSGRHQEMWKGNVVAIGNSYGFVEPLESTGILMICMEIDAMVDSFPASKQDDHLRGFINQAMARRWDSLRWFLGIHYKFNRKLDTEFWRTCRATADVTGIQTLLDLYAGGAPLTFRSWRIRESITATAPVFYALAGTDCVLLGQKVPCRLFDPPEPEEVWRRRKDEVVELARHALSQSEALNVLQRRPELLEAAIHGPDSWVTQIQR